MKFFNKKILTLAVVSVLTSGTATMAGTLQADSHALDLPPPPPGPYAAKQAGHNSVQNLMGSSVEMKVSEAPDAPVQEASAPDAPVQEASAPDAPVQEAKAPEAEMIEVPVTQPVLTSATAVPAEPQVAAQTGAAQVQPGPSPAQQAQMQMMYAPQQMPMQAMPGYGYSAGGQQMPMQAMPGYGYPTGGQQQMPMMYMPMPRMQYMYVVPVMPRMQMQQMRSHQMKHGQHDQKGEHQGKYKDQPENAEQ